MSTTKSRAWYYRWPTDFYATGPARFDRPVTEREARAAIRERYKMDRLPRGTELWPTK